MVTEIWSFKCFRVGVTTLTLWGYVTSSVPCYAVAVGQVITSDALGVLVEQEVETFDLASKSRQRVCCCCCFQQSQDECFKHRFLKID